MHDNFKAFWIGNRRKLKCTLSEDIPFNICPILNTYRYLWMKTMMETDQPDATARGKIEKSPLVSLILKWKDK